MSRALAVLMIFGVLAGVVGAALSAQPLPPPSAPLFAPADETQTRDIAPMPEQYGTRRTRYAQLDTAALSQLRSNTHMLNLFDDFTVTAVGGMRSDSAARGLSHTVWTGKVQGDPTSVVVAADNGAGIIDLRVMTLGRNFYVQTLTGGVVRISEIDPSAGRYTPGGQAINDAVPYTPTPDEIALVQANRASPRADDGSVIDVMVVYTPAAVGFLGGEIQMQLAIEATAALANVTYENSEVDFRLRVVHTALVDYVEQNNDLGKLSNPSDGHMDEIHAWRDIYAADLVALIPGTSVANRNYCGIANLALSMPAPESAFSITEALCISDITFAHELGHNMGKAHDPANGFLAIHSYAHGYQDPSEGGGDYGDWVTVMAYSTNGQCPSDYQPGVCPAIAWWSNPDQTFDGKPLGTVSTANNALSLGQTALDVANYRISPDGGTIPVTPVPTLTPVPTPTSSGLTMPLNGSFESDNDLNGVPDGWAWGAIAGKIKCDTGGGSKGTDGLCALALTPGASLKQTVPLDIGALGQGDTLHLSLDVKPKGSLGCAKAQLKVKYVDPQAGLNGDGKDKLTTPFPSISADWTELSDSLVLDGAPSKVVLKLTSGACVKTYRVDDVRLWVE